MTDTFGNTESATNIPENQPIFMEETEDSYHQQDLPFTVLSGYEAKAFANMLEELEPPKGIARLKKHFGKIELL